MRYFLASLSLVSILSCTKIAEYNYDLQGHRGCRGLLPENSISSMLKALELGVTTLEMDVVVSSDSVLLLSHEPFLSSEICLDQEGNRIHPEEESSFNLYKMKYTEIQNYDCGSLAQSRFLEQIASKLSKPRLSDVISNSEAFARYKGRKLPFYSIEIKSTPGGDGIFHPIPGEFVELLMKTVSSFDLKERLIIQSFDLRVLEYLHEKYPEVKTAYLVEESAGLSKDLEMLTFKPTVYSPYFEFVDESMIMECHERGIKIIPWTVNDLSIANKLLRTGVDGLITDYPDRIH
jgi:glycerophosphoryl diester phosphodiesterase